VLPLQAQRIEKETVEIISSLLVAELDASRRYRVISSADINAMLGLEKMKDAAGCDDVACAAEIGGALGVKYLVSGSVSRLGHEFIVQVSLIDVSRATVMERGRAVVEDDERNYRTAVERAAAELLGLELKKPKPLQDTKADTPPANPVDPASPVRLQFTTRVSERAFTVQATTASGAVFRCPQDVTIGTPCLLTGLSLGQGRLFVGAEPLGPFGDVLQIENDDEVQHFEIQERVAAGSVISWTFGGIALAAGAALLATGLALDKDGLLYGGIPAAAVGGGLLILGFNFDGDVHVDYPGWDWWAKR
jgi:hypothetical protein